MSHSILPTTGPEPAQPERALRRMSRFARSLRYLTPVPHGRLTKVKVAHHATILNDNRDGTFTEMGHYVTRAGGQKHLPPIVKSKNPLPTDAPALAEPNVTPGVRYEHSLSSASPVQSQSNSHHETQSGNNMTADQIMANESYKKRKLSAKESDSSKLWDTKSISSFASESSSPPEGATEQAQAAGHDQDAAELRAAAILAKSIAEENWATVKSFFTKKKLPRPEKGPIATLLACRREREIVARGYGRNLDIAWPKDVAMLIVQLVGREAPVPCNRCEKGTGMFQGCVMMSQEVADVLQNGRCTCVNCGWKSQKLRECDLDSRLKRAESSAVADGVTVNRGDEGRGDEGRGDEGRGDEGPGDEGPGDEGRADEGPADEGRADEGGHSSRPGRRSVRLLLTPKDKAQRGSPSAPIQRAASPLRNPTHEKTAPAVEPAYTKFSLTESEDRRFAFRVEIIRTGTGLQISVDAGHVRICTLAKGKVAVRLPGEPAFRMGPGGMFKLAPGARAEIVNTSGVDSVLHVTRLQVKR